MLLLSFSNPFVNFQKRQKQQWKGAPLKSKCLNLTKERIMKTSDYLVFPSFIWPLLHFLFVILSRKGFIKQSNEGSCQQPIRTSRSGEELRELGVVQGPGLVGIQQRMSSNSALFVGGIGVLLGSMVLIHLHLNSNCHPTAGQFKQILIMQFLIRLPVTADSNNCLYQDFVHILCGSMLGIYCI